MSMTLPIIDVLPIYQDNYVWFIVHPEHQQAYVVDPGDAEPVLAYLRDKNLDLSGILITHRHWDHVNGVEGVLERYHVPVYGPKHPAIPWVTNCVCEGSVLTLWDQFLIEVWSVPGHLPEQLNYLLKGEHGQAFFGGDTLFSCGCSRIFDGTPQELLQSLKRIANLPDDTPICTSHEYTLANIDFAQTVEPANTDLRAYKREAQQQRQANQPTLPTYSKREKAVNPFLRCTIEQVISSVEQHTGKKLANELEVFTELRKWKDHF